MSSGYKSTSVTHKSRAGLNVTREVRWYPSNRQAYRWSASRKHGGFTLVTPIVWMRPGILPRSICTTPSNRKTSPCGGWYERRSRWGASTSSLGTPAKDKAEYDSAEMTNVIVHVGCVVWPDLLGETGTHSPSTYTSTPWLRTRTFRSSIGWQSLALQQEIPSRVTHLE